MTPLEIMLVASLYIHGISDHYDYAHCLVTKESNWQVDAVGQAGEIGLAQIMPSTGVWFADMAGFELDAERLRSPDMNLYLLGWGLSRGFEHHWSTHYLCKGLKP